MKKILALLSVLSLSLTSFAFDYVPRNVNSNPFANNKQNLQKTEKTEITQKPKQKIQPEMREIKTIEEYFIYLPHEIQRHWTPYKAEKDYKVTVQFTIYRNGSISNVQIIGTDYPNANRAVINAIKDGAPYQPLPQSYKKDNVRAQLTLEYRAK